MELDPNQTWPKAQEQNVPGVRSSLAEDFSLTQGGPLHRLQVRLGASPGRRQIVRRALLATLVAWLPLLILSLAQGIAYGIQVTIPFLQDFAVNARFVVALPILILAESRIDQRWRNLVLQFPRSGLVNEAQLPSFEGVIQTITRLRDKVLPEAVMLVLAYIPSVSSVSAELLMSRSNWHSLGTSAGEMSLAGWWFRLISEPDYNS